MLILARHGQTAMNREGRLQGRVDAPLTDLGREQARAVARYLGESGAVRVVTSPLRRAVETAEAIAATLAAPVEIDERLVEIDYGTWDAQPLSAITADEWARWRADPNFAPPGGESLRAVGVRAVDAANDLLCRDGVTIAVSHVSPIKAVVAWALAADEGATWRMHLDVAAVCKVGMRGDSPYLAAFNLQPS